MADAAHGVELVHVDAGRTFDRWRSVSVTMSLDAVAHAFALSYSDKTDPLALELADSLEEGARVRVQVIGPLGLRLPVIEGWVDQVTLTETVADGPTIEVTGRSLTADLIDCAIKHDSGEWRDTSFATIIEEVCEPFGITPTQGDAAATGLDNAGLPALLAELVKRSALPFRRVSVEPGETVLDLLGRCARERGILLTANPDGSLAYTLAGGAKIPGKLRRGHEIGDGASRVGDMRDRFSEYRIVGQSAGDNVWHGAQARQGEATATDPQITRYRPMIEVSEGTSSGGDYQARADWERNRRAGQGRRVSLPVMTWLDPSGAVWLPNKTVDVDHAVLRIAGSLLIETVELAYDLDAGPLATLGLVPPGTYDPLQEPKTRQNRRMWASWA